MERYKIKFTKNATKDYMKLPHSYKALIDTVLYKLSEGKNIDLKPVIGEKNIYRIRVGGYRILFLKEDLLILITRIAPRGDAYKKK